eukprot:CAMPEP_0171998110 /NCGR_PEP_ID=MMETSP1041-20130122/1054_1 /TAXON_ID=464988 /ORGANISM="Hemiselmis andersenii, Strain CCMP439" /LENGTH=63 /DNA_ID=CAMNT_0012651447 /DNA_START=89 /DNA_END=280 /DNA_ORIENTATION=+
MSWSLVACCQKLNGKFAGLPTRGDSNSGPGVPAGARTRDHAMGSETGDQTTALRVRWLPLTVA